MRYLIHIGRITDATSNAATSTTTTAQPSATPSNPVDQEPSTNPAPSTSSRSNAGAIAGGVVGGVVFLVAVVGILWILLRRRRESKKRAFDRRAVNLDEDEAPSSFPPTEGYTNDRVVPPISVARMPYPHVRLGISSPAMKTYSIM
jgi:predicted lipid-binding transport protein (Tim44 family)